MQKNFKVSFVIFLLFTLFLLIEGFFYYYSAKLSYFCFQEFTLSKYCSGELTQEKYTFFNKSQSGYNPLIWNEKGLVETIQVILILISIINFFQIIKSKTKLYIKKFFFYFLIFYFMGLLYYFFEEISWGQHYFEWRSSDFFIKYNNQQETNLHNISNLLDQLPRSFLTLWCCLSFILHKFIIKNNSNKKITKFILPSEKLKFISFLLILFFLPDFIFGQIFTEIDYSASININFSDIYTFITFNFIKLSEYQELIFALYIFYHSIFFKKYIFSNN